MVTKAVWVFEDNGPARTVTADDSSFTSDRRMTAEFKRAFAAPGEVAYHCEVQFVPRPFPIQPHRGTGGRHRGGESWSATTLTLK